MNSSIGYKEAEVVVAGGGTGGACAAIAAARNGADVLLVEQQGFLGGLCQSPIFTELATKERAGDAARFAEAKKDKELGESIAAKVN